MTSVVPLFTPKESSASTHGAEVWM